MMNEDKLTRSLIIQTLVDTLKPLHYTHAFWEGGAAAFNRIDEWSDIDLYLVVNDEKVDEAFLQVEKALESLSPIEQKYEVSHPPQTVLFQAFYKLKDFNEYLIIDFAVLTLSSPDKYLEEEIHGKAVFYFNKSDEVKPPLLNKKAFVENLHKRLERLMARFNLFNNFVQKEINRGNYLEAIDSYHVITLAGLTEILRIRYHPVHHNFRMRYVHYELPSEVIEKLKPLYFVKDEEDLEEKYRKASEWFQEIMLEVNQKGFERKANTYS